MENSDRTWTTTVSLDWFRYSAPSNYALDLMVPYELHIDHQQEEIKPLPHYTNAMLIHPAGRIDWNTIDPKQGSLVTFGGRDLTDIRNAGITSDYLIKYTVDRKWLRASRLDLAIDVRHRVAHPLDILDAWNAGKCKSHAQKCREIQEFNAKGKTLGETVYVGSRKSDTFLRIYDKNAEQGGDELHTRIELELKSQQAHMAQTKIGSVGMAQVAASKLNDFIQVSGVGWWRDMLAVLPAANDIMRGERKQQETTGEKWLHEQALPAVIKGILTGDMLCLDSCLKAFIARSKIEQDLTP